MRVYVVVADCGLNGPWVLAVRASEPTRAEVEAYVTTPPDPAKPHSFPRRVTGFQFVEVVEMEVTE